MKRVIRLIDADKLANKSCPMGKRKYCCNCGEKRTIKDPYTNQSISCDDIRFDFLQMIDREKTVKAIPIKWLKEWEGYEQGMAIVNLKDIVEYWENKNDSK